MTPMDVGLSIRLSMFELPDNGDRDIFLQKNNPLLRAATVYFFSSQRVILCSAPLFLFGPYKPWQTSSGARRLRD